MCATTVHHPRLRSRKEPLSVFLLALAALLAGVSAASAQQQAVTLAARGGASVTLAPEHDHMPSAATFRIEGTSITVGITKVELLGRGGISSSDCRLTDAAGARSAVTTVHFADGARAQLTTTVYDEKPTLQLQVSGQATGCELVFHLSGADRLICSSGGGFATASLGRQAGSLSVDGSAVVLQRRSDQHGLAVAAENMRLESAAGGARLHVPLTQRQGMPVSVEVTGFRGDALIAYEEAVERAGRSAEPPSVAALAARQHRAALGAPRPQAEAQPIGKWLWWTGTDRVFRPLLADPREAQVRVGVGYGKHAQKFLEAGIGGDLVIAKKRFALDEELSVSLRGSIIGRLDTCESSFPLLNADFFGGVAAGYRRGNNTWEAYLFHESSHLGDEIVERQERRRIDSSREAIRILWSHDFGNLRVYGGPTFNFRAFPSEVRRKFTLQAGAEYRWIAWNTPIYVAADVQSKEENNWDVNLTTQFGIELGDPEKVQNRPRVFVELYNGFSNMGQFYNEHERYIMLGFGYNF